MILTLLVMGIATFAFIGVATLSDDQPVAWGWRVPFWFSALILVVGLLIRSTVRDTDAFVTEKESGTTAKVPLGEVRRHQPWDVVRLIFAELFNVRYRVTGMAVGLQLGLVLTSFSPVIIQAVSAANDNAWWPAVEYTTLACVVSAIAIATGRETCRTPPDQLGVQR